MYKHNPEWVSGGPWYNTYICKELHGKLFEVFIRNSRIYRYKIMCSIDAHEKLIRQNMIMEAAVGFVHYHQIQQQKHWFRSVQPYISLVVG